MVGETVEEYINKHGRVILSSDIPRKVGDSCFGKNYSRTIPNQVFVIVREATREEYMEQNPNINFAYGKYFYEVTTD